ncbi:hypothetical protein [Ruminococcus sp.]|uniref:hypothetical protein n=1 Tax=Ruminococcus sp. TaxID=41978 RepID=UPI002E7A726B|nr:hypothetical protein [Ruminococcus sp.]MEE1396676.1 hypothetical protein [Ruminococcus sp.]
MPNHPPRTPKEYQEEMMRLYRAAQAAAPPPVPAPEPPEEVPEPSPAPEPEPVLAPSPEPLQELPPAPEPAAPEEPVVEFQLPPAAPPPELDAPPPKPELVPEPPAPDSTLEDIGWLQVITRGAGNAMSLPGVSVLVSTGTGADLQVKYVSVTNSRGETGKVPLPAPPASISLNKDETQQAYSTYDVSVYLSGYYPQVSKDVPVFAGITSRQIFSMTPLPAYPDNPPEPTVFQNNEPRF